MQLPYSLSSDTLTRQDRTDILDSDSQSHIFFQTSARRISNLVNFHCSAALDVDFKGLM